MNLNYQTFTCLALVLSGGAAFGESGQRSQPLYVKNLSPVTGLLGLPSQRSAHTQAAGSYALALHSSIASHYVVDSAPAERLNLDGETLRFAFESRYGLSENWDVQLEVPWLAHSDGKLDKLIDNWHDFWGMPDGGRSYVDRNILDFNYRDPAARFSLGDDTSGLGDISISLNHVFYRSGDTVLSASGGYKFATGNEDKMLGSGAGDVFFSLRFSGPQLSDLPLSWHGQLGYLYAGDSDLLGPRQENNLWFAGISVDWALSQQFSLIAQLDMNTAPISSDLPALGDEAIMGSLGGRWHFADKWALDFSFIEDIQVAAAPDITFQASVRYAGAN